MTTNRNSGLIINVAGLTTELRNQYLKDYAADPDGFDEDAWYESLISPKMREILKADGIGVSGLAPPNPAFYGSYRCIT